MATHNRIYITPSHTKKIFANMRRQGKEFSGKVTPLFPTMVVQAQEEIDEAVYEEPSMQLKELIDFCTKLQQRVLDLENTKTAQAMIIPIISKNRIFFPPNEASLGDQEDASKQGRKIDDIDADAEIYMCCCTQLTEDEITLAQALAELKSVKPKVTIATTTTTKGILLQEPSESITTTTTIPSKDKGKGSEVRVEIAEVAVCDAIPLATNASKLVTTRFLKRKDQLLSKIIRADWKFKRRHFKTLSLDELRSPDFNLLSDHEYLKKEEEEAMAETMEQYMSKTRTDYGSGVARPKIDNKYQFELKGQFIKEL
ncbi:hypothetical protein Tco_0025052 [Tanacetum coccineum]